MGYKDTSKKNEHSKLSMRAKRALKRGEREFEGEGENVVPTPNVVPFIREKMLYPERVPLALLFPAERARQVRKAMIQTLGLTREAYERNLEGMVGRKQEDNQALGLKLVALEERMERLEAILKTDTERIAALSYRIAEMEADNVLMVGTGPEETDMAREVVERDEEDLV